MIFSPLLTLLEGHCLLHLIDHKSTKAARQAQWRKLQIAISNPGPVF